LNGLHDFYHDFYDDAVERQRKKDATSEEEQLAGANHQPPPADVVVPETTDESIIADKEYLQYLSQLYMKQLSEAFDDDDSGFIRISEVNDLIRRKPEGWSLLQW
jgi:hypothetical protein